MPHSHQGILQAANAAVVRGDHEGFLQHCADDTEWVFLGDRTLRGKDAIRPWMATSYRTAPPRLKVRRMVAQGDFLTAIGEIVLTDADGTQTQHAYCDVWRLEDGKLAQLHAYVLETDEDLSELASDRGSMATRPKIAGICRGRTRSDMSDTYET